jgi:hypothetical protein
MAYKFNPFTGQFDDSPDLVTSTTAGLIPAPPEGEPSGKVFTDALEWAEAPGGGATPAGSAGDIQIHDGEDPAGLGAVTGFKWDAATDTLDVPGDINLDDGGTYTTTLQMVTATANRTISFPDATGTVGLVAGSSGNLVANQSGAYAGVTNSSVDSATGNITLGSRFISSLNGAASAPPVAFTGTWFTGGTATTTKPHVLIEPTGTTSTAWSTSGTGLGVNAASGFAGNLLDLQVNGTSSAFVTSGGGIRGAYFLYRDSVTGIRRWTGSAFYLSANGQDVAGILQNGLPLRSSCIFGWTSGEPASAQDVSLARDAANTLAQRNGTNAQTYRLYNTFTSATNFERLNFRWTTNEAIIDTEAGSDGGTLRGLKIGSAGTSLLGFYGATPVVQPAAVTDITTTATAGTLPTPDGTVTIADADVPTVDELLEYCVELEAKLEAALGHLRTLGLIAA